MHGRACPVQGLAGAFAHFKELTMEHLFIPLSLAAGGLLNVQAGANAQLS
jgi:hypothetical protein